MTHFNRKGEVIVLTSYFDVSSSKSVWLVLHANHFTLHWISALCVVAFHGMLLLLSPQPTHDSCHNIESILKKPKKHFSLWYHEKHTFQGFVVLSDAIILCCV